MVRVSVELSTFIHSTEDEGRVLEALLRGVPGDARRTLLRDLRVQTLEGHYGNVIKVARLSVGRELAAEVLRYVLCGMSRTDRDILLSTLEGRVEPRRARLHLRLSKQDLYLGRMVLSEGGDVVKVVVSFEGIRRGDLERLLRELGESCAG